MSLKWYDKISYYYDFVTLCFYRNARKKLINSINIKENDNILIIACGTGQSFALFQEKLRGTGQIVAVDSSEGMLKQSRKKICSNNWKNIRLIQADARDISIDFFAKMGIHSQFDVVIGELAFSVIPEYEKVMKNSIDLLINGGKIGLLDWYRPENDVITKIVNYFADAQITRETASYAESLVLEYKTIYKFFFQSIYVGIGIKQEYKLNT
jgi:ubiquinone/menaquinone biosynthesis C-methylase UbiE